MTKQLFVTAPPDWKEHSPAYPRELDLPREWIGRPIEWTSGYQPPAVFIGQLCLPSGGDVYLFGLRHDLSKAKIEGETEQDGNFLEYIVQELIDNSCKTHRLRQYRSSTYSSSATKRDHISASDLGKRKTRSLCVGEAPNWKPDDARWPTLDGEPMRFVGQFQLVENDVTLRFLICNHAVFVFWDQDDHGSVFKITHQRIDYQSASDHYARQ